MKFQVVSETVDKRYYNGKKRKKMNFLDEGRCLCCNSGKERSLGHLVYECEAFRNERIHIPGTIDDNESLVDRVRSLLGIGAEEDVDWESRGRLAGRITSVLRTKWGERVKEEESCENVLYVEVQ